MSKTILLFCFALILSVSLFAQCTPKDSTGVAGVTPHYYSQEFSCVMQGAYYHEVIYIENWDSIVGLNIQFLRLDSIGPIYFIGGQMQPYTGFPNDLYFTTNLGDAPVTWSSGETGCITISGLAGSDIQLGTWKLGIYITLWIDGLGPISGEAGELMSQFNSGDFFDCYLKVQTDSIYYYNDISEIHVEPQCYIMVGINQYSTISNFTISPNPFTTSTQITFNATQTGNHKTILTDVVGKTVFSRDIEIINGLNQLNIDRDNLTSGLYFYTISNGQQSISKHLLIQD